MVVDTGGPKPNDVFDYNFAELCTLYRTTIDPEKWEMVKSLRDRQIIS